MHLLLDTHVLLWWAGGADLSDEAVRAISDVDNMVHVSAATTWEISIKRALGKLEVGDGLLDMIREDFEPLDINYDHATAAGELAQHHRDPFDRMLIAQALAEGLTLVTRDAQFAAYEVPLLAA